MNFEQAGKNFMARDENAVEDFNASFAWRGHPSIEERLTFAEGRLKDVAAMLVWALARLASRETASEDS